MIAKSFKEKDSIEIIDEELRDSSAINRKNLEEYEAIKKESLMKDRENASLKDHIKKMECELLKRAAEYRNLTKVLKDSSEECNQVAVKNKLLNEKLAEKESEINFLIRNLDESDKEMHKQQAKLNEKISILTFLKKLYG